MKTDGGPAERVEPWRVKSERIARELSKQHHDREDLWELYLEEALTAMLSQEADE